MKTYKNLFDDFLSTENITLAIINASKGKRNKPNVSEIYENKEKYIEYFRAYASNFKNKKHTPKEIYDGISRKKRTIIVPTFEEQVVHHMVVNILKPIIGSRFYFHSYGSIPNKGAHKAKKFLDKWVRKDVRNTKYVLQMDIRKYFDSIPHYMLKQKISKSITDERFLCVLYEIIDVIPQGLPLGFYTSQWLANFYLTDLDNYIKQKLSVKYYVRYMDDMVILGSNKRKLHSAMICIEQCLKSIGLNLKYNHQVYKLKYNKVNGRALDFMGFKFYRHKTILRKKIFIRMCRKARKLYKKEKPTIYDCRQMLSYVGWLNATDTYGAYLEYIKPFIDIKQLKKRVSAFDRRKNKCG